MRRSPKNLRRPLWGLLALLPLAGLASIVVAQSDSDDERPTHGACATLITHLEGGGWRGRASTPIGPVDYDIRTHATPSAFTLTSATGGQAVHTWRFRDRDAMCALTFHSTFGAGQSVSLTGGADAPGRWRFDTAPGETPALRVVFERGDASRTTIAVRLRGVDHVQIALER